MIFRKRILRYAIVFLFITACEEQQKEAPLSAEILEIKLEYAPDKRVALFDIFAEQKEGIIILKGESNLPDAVNAFKDKLNAGNISFVDSMQLLPSKELQGKTNAIVTISVANLRSKPKHSAELATQATLGTPVKVLKKEGEWYYIQTPDNYLSWVDHGGITLMDEQNFKEWKASDKYIYTKTYGHSYVSAENEQAVSDLVAGSILEIAKENHTDQYYAVTYPDGRNAYIKKNEAEVYNTWLAKLDLNSDALVETAKALMGVPYLWGGTSTKGMDCSGFTKTIYFLNGMVIPRDASQQVHTGKQTDEDKNFDNLEKGDLLFFGRKATDTTVEKVVHVGMWIGNNEFIHASGQVRINSMDPNAENYDSYNFDRYLRSKRILKEEDKDLIDLKQTPVF